MIMDFPTVNFQLGSSDIFVVKNGACDSTQQMECKFHLCSFSKFLMQVSRYSMHNFYLHSFGFQEI